ncbi:hypothetical protein DFJ73DRAFT_822895 [Zopfochytrium polystomum]|nr:hypothetical protein DFJ73DRAFT_822895 [Zopfochytrium polystomum]
MWAVAFAAGMGGMLFGYEIGIINQILSITSFLFYFKIFGPPDNYNPDAYYDPEDLQILSTTDRDKGLVTSSFLYGCVVGAAAVSLLADVIGRKFSIILGGIIYTAGGCLQAAAVNFPTFLFGRGMSGMSVGIMSMSVPLYIAETAPTAIRGRLTTVYQLMITFGILVASCVNGIIVSVMGRKYDLAWRLALALQVVPGLTLLILMLPMPRSPRWLAEKGFHAEGQRVIARLRGFEDEDEDEVVVEYRSIMAGVEYERRIGTAGWTHLLRKGVRRRLVFGVVNQFFQQWTGINVILYYGYDLFKQLKFGNVNSSVVFIIVNAFINFAFTLPGMWGVERFGRRPLFIFGGMAMCFAYCIVFVFSTLAPAGQGYAWVAVLGIYTFTISFACTWGPVVWTYQSEIFPLRIRAKGTGLSTMSNWIWNAVIAQIQPSLSTSLHINLYLIFVGTCFLMTIYAWKFIPETRGKTLEDMDEVFKDGEAVLPSQGLEWSATVAALFTMRGYRSRSRQDHGHAASGDAPAGFAKDSRSFSSRSHPSASSAGHSTLDDGESQASGSSSARPKVFGSSKKRAEMERSSNIAPGMTALSDGDLADFLTATGDDFAAFNLPANFTTPFSASKKPKSSAMKKSAAVDASPPPNFAITDELSGFPLSFDCSAPSTSSLSSSRQRSRSVGSTASRPDDLSIGTGTLSVPGTTSTRLAATSLLNTTDPADPAASGIPDFPGTQLPSSLLLQTHTLPSVVAPTGTSTTSTVIGQWPPAFVVRLGQTRAAQQLQQSLRGHASGRRSSSPADALPQPGANSGVSRPSSAQNGAAFDGPPRHYRRGRSGTPSPSDAFALPSAPPRTPRSRSVDTGRSSGSVASTGPGRGLSGWIIEEDYLREFARR